MFPPGDGRYSNLGKAVSSCWISGLSYYGEDTKFNAGAQQKLSTFFGWSNDSAQDMVVQARAQLNRVNIVSRLCSD